MSTTVTPSTGAGAARSQRATRVAPARIARPALRALAIFVVLAAIGLAISLALGAASVFNVLVCLLFAVLWAAVFAALAFSPATLDQVWSSVRRRHFATQAAIWLLFLPIMIGLWIWERAWTTPIRLILLLTIAVWNLFLFFPRG